MHCNGCIECDVYEFDEHYDDMEAMLCRCECHTGGKAMYKGWTYECNLCGMKLTLLTTELDRHEEWHYKARIQHRNTTQGIVEWIVD